MSVSSVNAQELAIIASEIGADVLQGILRYPSETGGYQLGDTDLSEHLDRNRDQWGLVKMISIFGYGTSQVHWVKVA